MNSMQTKGWWLTGGAAVVAAVLGATHQQWWPTAPQGLIGTAVPANQTVATQTAPAPAPAAPAAAPADAKPASGSAAAPAPATQVASAESPPAVVSPTAPVVPSFDTVRVEKTGDAVVAGRAAPRSEVTLKLGSTVVGTATAGADGTFVIIPAVLPVGTGSLSLEAKAPGSAVAVASQQTVAVVVPQQAQSAPVVALVNPDAPTKVLQPAAAPAPSATPVKNADLSLDAVDYDTTGNIVFSGRFAPGATARVYVDNKLAGEARAGDDSHWSFAGGQITTGVHALRVDGLDAKGGVTARVEVPFFREQTTKVASAATSDAPAVEAAAPAPAQPSASTAAAPQPAAAPAQTQASATVQVEPAKPKNGRVVIQPGNNLWTIATVIYGNGTKYAVLYGANKDLIRNPNLIYPGQVFATPDVVPPEQIDPSQHTPMAAPAASN